MSEKPWWFRDLRNKSCFKGWRPHSAIKPDEKLHEYYTEGGKYDVSCDHLVDNYEESAAYIDLLKETVGMSEFKPTNRIKWFLTSDSIDEMRPLAQIAGYPECGPDYYCLKQLWRDDQGNEEWRDVEVVE